MTPLQIAGTIQYISLLRDNRVTFMERNESRERIGLPLRSQPEGDGLLGGGDHHLLSSANAEAALFHDLELSLSTAERSI